MDRAIEIVEVALKQYGPPLYVRRQIVHNTYVVEDLAARGVIFTDELGEVPDGTRVVFSAHGVASAVRQEAVRKNLDVIDATCPLVAKVHAEAKRFSRDDYDILLIGHADHEEVVSTTGEAADHIRIVDPDDDHSPDLGEVNPERVAWLSQTTLAVDDVRGAIDGARKNLPALRDPPSGDICYASQNRQDAVKLIASRVSW